MCRHIVGTQKISFKYEVKCLLQCDLPGAMLEVKKEAGVFPSMF